MKAFNKIENDIRKSSKNFKKPSARNGALKLALWVIRPVQYAITETHMALKKVDANIDAPMEWNAASASSRKQDLVDIEESIEKHTRAIAKLNKQIKKAKSKLNDAKGDKKAKWSKIKRESQEEIESLKAKIGRNQELHASITKKLAKKGLLVD